MKKLILTILSKIYGVVTAVRNFLFDRNILKSYQSKIRVVSVGNLTAGGNGKTMIVLELCQGALERALRPVVLSRGYGGKERGPYLVTDNDNAAGVGDEPLLIHQRGKGAWRVVIARSRVEGAKFIEANALGDVIILDDGFQHRWLKRDIDIIAVNITGETALEEFKKAELLPLGLFRESKMRAVKRATHVLFVSRSPQDNRKELTPFEEGLPRHVRTSRALFAVATLEDQKGDISLSTKEVNVFCALGNPQGFLQTVEALGFSVKAKLVLKDHETPTPEQLGSLKDRPILCTEKDFVKLSPKDREGVHKLGVGLDLDEDFVTGIL